MFFKTAVENSGCMKNLIFIGLVNEIYLKKLSFFSDFLLDSARELRRSSEFIQLLTVIMRCHPALIRKYATEKNLTLKQKGYLNFLLACVCLLK